MQDRCHTAATSLVVKRKHLPLMTRCKHGCLAIWGSVLKRPETSRSISGFQVPPEAAMHSMFESWPVWVLLNAWPLLAATWNYFSASLGFGSHLKWSNTPENAIGTLLSGLLFAVQYKMASHTPLVLAFCGEGECLVTTRETEMTILLCFLVRDVRPFPNTFFTRFGTFFWPRGGGIHLLCAVGASKNCASAHIPDETHYSCVSSSHHPCRSERPSAHSFKFDRSGENKLWSWKSKERGVFTQLHFQYFLNWYSYTNKTFKRSEMVLRVSNSSVEKPFWQMGVTQPPSQKFTRIIFGPFENIL